MPNTDPASILRGERGYAMLAAADGAPPTIYLYAEILPAGLAEFFGGVSASKVLADLKEAEGAPEIAVRINSPGGDVQEGAAVYNALARFPGKVVVHVDGLAGSIASLVMLAGDEIRIAENAMVMVHRPWSFMAGNAAEHRHLADALDKGWAAMLKTYQGRTGKKQASIEKAIEDGGGEWWMTADEAAKHGFADSVEKMSAKAAVYGLQNFRHVPERLAASAEKGAPLPAPRPVVLSIEGARVERPAASEAAPAAPTAPSGLSDLTDLEFLSLPRSARSGGLQSPASPATKP